ncbi:MAG: shikimate kinase [Dehalococcoidales bacterium]|jgi:shikimate kinase|nr:shikimate kinase [Dehalococcoidales bacterium]|tara:strand:- start:2147 stop:2677 length:531 start_codon:yes stop_codon:yes gene_type:complete
MKTNIALIGFMGTGKTAVGKALVEKLSKEFVEMDALIEQKAGKPIPEIFQQDGEIAFRELEINLAKEIAQRKNLVIACGGGIVLNKINIDRLRKESIIVYLTALPEVILRRVSGGQEIRPLLNVADKTSEIRELLKFRKPFYERAADIQIDTSKLTIASVAKQIIDKLKGNESLNF